ncbi:MAG: Nre family DNA repair protein [Candidatus Altiarchaeota archaeon]
MLKGKGHYLKEITAQTRLRSVEVGRELEGSCPPSVFIGAWNYPKVYAGPMMTPYHGDTAVFDTPEEWIPSDKTQENIINYRLSLVRGKHPVKVTDTEDGLVAKLREISMAKESIESEARFSHEPKGLTLSDEHTPHGPSALIERFEIENCRWDKPLEKAYYDTDLKASDAVMELYGDGVPFSRIQKAFSVGCMGDKRRRRLVPTRWSITACDSTLGNRLLQNVRHNDIVDCYRTYEFDSLNNRYAVMLTPTAWQYEWTEAFRHIIGDEELIFSDHESNAGKKGYSTVGGCYYSCKFAVLEALERMKKQAGAIILREAYKGYIPLGVFNVRENVRAALRGEATEHNSLKDALADVGSRMRLPRDRYMRETELLKEMIRGTQTTLTAY